MRTRSVVKGLLTFVPFLRGPLTRQGPGGAGSAVCCYEVWLKHLTLLSANGLRSVPNAMLELGPGESLGVGLAAMLSGVNHYSALDAAEYAKKTSDLRMLEELVALFRARAPRPLTGWPNYDAYLDKDLFPSHILTHDLLKGTVSEARVAQIRDALASPNSPGGAVSIRYIAPWSDENVVPRESVDLILSQSVLEHVDDLRSTYRDLYLWLKPGGMMSHQIDFSAHTLSKEWNGHWACSDLLWKILVGKRPYLLNRQPCSVHTELMKSNGFEIVCDLKYRRTDGIRRSQLAARWRDLSDDDLTCGGAFIQAKKKVRPPVAQ
ncbi:MAG TPA: methyltransferase domain-containing protein [bacterium]|nr:methyltransferase domain-containing protein [bacterium]